MATTWNPSDKGTNITLSNSDKTATSSDSASWRGVRSTTSKTSGKWQAEIVAGNVADGGQVAIANSSFALDNAGGAGAGKVGYFSATGNKYNEGGGAAYGASYTAGDVITVLLDCDNKKATFKKNNTSQGEITFTFNGPYSLALCMFACSYTLRTASDEFSYALESGYSAWDTAVAASPRNPDPICIF